MCTSVERYSTLYMSSRSHATLKSSQFRPNLIMIMFQVKLYIFPTTFSLPMHVTLTSVVFVRTTQHSELLKFGQQLLGLLPLHQGI